MPLASHKPLCSIALLILAGCQQGGTPGPVVFDFAARLGGAEAHREVDEIRFGTPDARAHLREGWSLDEKTPDGHPFVWSEGQESTLDFFLSSPRKSLEIAFRCLPLDRPASPPQRLSLALNGGWVIGLALAPGLREYRTLLPGELLREGHNRLQFRYAYTRIPAEGSRGSADRRSLAVAWFGLRFRGVEGASGREPSVEAETGVLRIPFGMQLDYYLELPEAGVLSADAVRFAAGRKGRLSVLLEPEGEAERVLAAWESSDQKKTIPLPGESGKLARLSFRAVPSEPGGEAPETVSLVRPVLRRRRWLEATPAVRPSRPPRKPHVFIYLVDTLRADHLGCYGYPKPVSPNIDGFAAESTRFRAVAQSSWTKASVASIFTGLSPIRHGAQDRGDTLAPEATTLSELLAAAGYHTGALYANAWLGDPFALDQGFQDRRLILGRSDRAHREFVAWLGKNVPRGQPLFAYVHTVDPHAPYAPPPQTRARFAPRPTSLRSASVAWLADLATRRRRGYPIPDSVVEDIVALYDAEIAFNDAQFGLFIAELKRRGLYDEALIVFTSDHGEEFFEKDNLGHGFDLNAEVLDIPLIVKWPRAAGVTKREELARAQHVDLLPTILDALGLPAPPGIEGGSLLARLTGESPSGETIFSYLDLDGLKAQSVEVGSWKLIRTGKPGLSPATVELYDLAAGGERKNLAAERPLRASYLLAQLRGHAAAQAERLTPGRGMISEDLAERLRALGYLR